MTWRITGSLALASFAIAILSLLWNVPWWGATLCGGLAGWRIDVWFGSKDK